MEKLAVTDADLRATARDFDAASIRQHTEFRAAADLHSELAMRQLSAKPGVRWLFKDMGRAAVLTRALMCDAEFGCVTLADLLRITGRQNTSSVGRVLQVIKRAEKLELLAVADSQGPRMRRRLVLRPALVEFFRLKATSEVRAAAVVAPEIRPCIDALADDLLFQRFLVHLRRFDGMEPDLRGPPTPAIRHFLQHEAGMTMLRSLQLSQDRSRERLLDAARFSRAGLAKSAMVGRTHVSRMFERAEAAGWLSLDAPRRITFSPAFCEEFEWFFAVTFQVIRASALAAMRGVDVDIPPAISRQSPASRRRTSGRLAPIQA
jgi:hypothetical protein